MPTQKVPTHPRTRALVDKVVVTNLSRHLSAMCHIPDEFVGEFVTSNDRDIRPLNECAGAVEVKGGGGEGAAREGGPLMVHEGEGERGWGWSGGEAWGQRNLPWPGDYERTKGEQETYKGAKETYIWPSDYERTHSLARRTAHILKSTLYGGFR
jgi:hypothetical protein